MTFNINTELIEIFGCFLSFCFCPKAPIQDNIAACFYNFNSLFHKIFIYYFGKSIVKLTLLIINQIIGSFIY